LGVEIQEINCLKRKQQPSEPALAFVNKQMESFLKFQAQEKIFVLEKEEIKKNLRWIKLKGQYNTIGLLVGYFLILKTSMN
jgi:hypothetical protein